MNVFTSPAYLETVGELYYAQRRWAVELCRVEGRVLRLLVLDGKTVLTEGPYYDFPQPLESVPPGPIRELKYFPRTVQRTEKVAERLGPEPKGLLASPYVDWSAFADWKAFTEWTHAHGSQPGNLERRRRKAEKNLGPLSFVFDDQRPEVFDACIQWKAAQYVATGLQNNFASERNVELFRRLLKRGVLKVSSLWGGSTLLSAHLGSLHDGRFTYWLPAYDAAKAQFSPGRILLEDLLMASHDRGDQEFDFLLGGEDYKFNYATHNRVIGPLGPTPLKLRVLSEARRLAKKALENSPRSLALARRLRDTVRDLRGS
jgi:hypothetical protein